MRMRHAARIASLGALASAALCAGALAPAAQAAGFGVAKFEAGTCNGNEAEVKDCEYTSPPSAFYTQAAGHPPWGLTGVELAHTGTEGSRVPNRSAAEAPPRRCPPGSGCRPADARNLHTETVRSENLQMPGRQRSGLRRTGSRRRTAGARQHAPHAERASLQPGPGSRAAALFGVEVEGVPPLVEASSCSWKATSAGRKNQHWKPGGFPLATSTSTSKSTNIPSEVAVKVLALPVAKRR